MANVAGDSDSGSFGVAPLSLFYRRLPFFPLSLPTPRSSPFSVDPIKGPKRRVSVINLLRVDLIPVFRSLFLSNALVDGPISIPPRLDDKFSKVWILREARKYSRSLFYRGWKERRRLERSSSFSFRSKFSKVVKLEFKKRVRWKNQYRQEERNYPFDIVERVMSRRNERGGIRKREFCVIIRVWSCVWQMDKEERRELPFGIRSPVMKLLVSRH